MSRRLSISTTSMREVLHHFVGHAFSSVSQACFYSTGYKILYANSCRKNGQLSGALSGRQSLLPLHPELRT